MENDTFEYLRMLEDEYDFNELFSGKSKYGAALKVITPNQEITLSAEESYAKVAGPLMKVLYDDYESSSDFNESFPDDFNDRCAIVVLLMDGPFEIVYVPKVINSFQYGKLLEFYNEMLNLCKKTGRKIDIHTNVFYQNERELGKVLDVIEERVNDTYDFPSENVLEDNLKRM